jgi:pimeloyl-ACP methyl ester carboxylesterase
LQPFISVTPVQIQPGGSINISGHSFRANSVVKVNVSNPAHENSFSQHYIANQFGEFSSSYSSSINSEAGIYSVKAIDTLTQVSAPVKNFEMKSPGDTFALKITSPVADSLDNSISLEWIDKLLPGSYYSIDVQGQRNYSYKAEYTFDGVNWNSTGSLIGRQNVYSIPMFSRQIDISTSNRFRTGNQVKFKVTDELNPSRQYTSQFFPIKANMLTKAQVNYLWDDSYTKPNQSIKGVCADGVGRFYIRVSKLTGSFFITGINLKLTDEQGNVIDKSKCGKLKLATVINGYSNEANNASLTELTTNTSQSEYRFWYVAPDDFDRDGAIDGNKLERKVKLNVTVSYSNGPPEKASYNISIIRNPLVLMHGFGSSGKVWETFYSRVRDKFKFISAPTLEDPSKSFKENGLLLLNRNPYNINMDPYVYKNSILSLIHEARNSGYACNQVSYVGHSMGGCIARATADLDSFECKKNYGLGFIDRLITIDTPHDGSPFADLFVYFASYLNRPTVDIRLLILKQLIKEYIRFTNNPLITSGYRIEGNTVMPTGALNNLKVIGPERYHFQNTNIPSFLISVISFPLRVPTLLTICGVTSVILTWKIYST